MLNLKVTYGVNEEDILQVPFGEGVEEIKVGHLLKMVNYYNKWEALKKGIEQLPTADLETVNGYLVKVAQELLPAEKRLNLK